MSKWTSEEVREMSKQMEETLWFDSEMQISASKMLTYLAERIAADEAAVPVDEDELRVLRSDANAAAGMLELLKQARQRLDDVHGQLHCLRTIIDQHHSTRSLLEYTDKIIKLSRYQSTADVPAAQPPIDLAAIREVSDWVEAKREHRRLVAVYNARVEYARQHEFGTVSIDHEFQAMNNQQRAMYALIQPMFEALDKLSHIIGDTP